MALKFSVLTLLLFLSLYVSFAHGQCQRSISEAPAISGLKIGMSSDEVQLLLGSNTKIKPFKSGTGTIYLSFAEQAPPENLRDIGTLWVRLFENRVYQVEAFYSDTAKTERIESFLGELSTTYQISPAAWQVKNNYATLDCGEFLIKADVVLNRHLEVTDKALKAEFEKKRSEDKAKKKS